MSALVDLGYGSPTTGGISDTGYGSPSTYSTDLGFGSPSTSTAVILQVISATELTDDAGAIVRLQGDVGPYSSFWFRLVGADTTEYPAAPAFAWSGIPSGGEECPVLTNGQEVLFVQPPAPVGIYTVRVYLDDSGGSYADAVNQVEVKRRVYFGATYRLRQSFPTWWFGTGPRMIQFEHLP